MAPINATARPEVSVKLGPHLDHETCKDLRARAILAEQAKLRDALDTLRVGRKEF